MIKHNENLINENILLRFGGLPIDSFEEFFRSDCLVYDLKQKINSRKNDIEIERDQLINLIYLYIENKNPLHETRLSLINIKRKLFNKKKLGKKDISIIQEGCKENEIVHRLNKIVSLNEEIEDLSRRLSNEFINENIVSFNILAALTKDQNFLKAISLSSPSMFKSILRYYETPPKKIRTKERKFLVSLTKYLSRTVYKTSPFSFFCVQGIGRISGQTNYKISEMTTHSFSRINQSIFLRNIDKSEEDYILNPNIWLDEKTATLLKKYDGPLPETTYKNKESIINIECGGLLENFIAIAPEKKGNFSYWTSVLKNIDNSLCDEEYTHIVEQFINCSLLIKSLDLSFEEYAIENSYNNNSLDLYYLGAKVSNSSPQKRIEILDNIKKKVENLNMKIQDSLVSEDVMLKDRVRLNKDDLNPILSELNLVFRVLPIFDISIRNRLSFNQFIKKKQNKNTNIPSLLVEFNHFLKINKSKYGSNPYQLEEIQKLDELYLKMKGLIGESLRTSSNSTVFSKDFLEEISISIPGDLSKDPYSAMFYFQLSNNNEIFINKIYSGFSRCFSRYGNYDEELAKSLRENLVYYEKQFNQKFADIRSSVGFNANLHPYLTERFINYNNERIKKPGEINLNSLRFELGEKTIRLKENTKEIFPLHLGQMSSLHLPTNYKYLFSLFHFDTLNFLGLVDLQRDYASQSPIQLMPEIKFSNTIISRKKWLINKLELVNLLQKADEGLAYLKIFDYFEQWNLPLEFFTYPVEGIKFNDAKKINDYFKPQFINLQSKQFFRLFMKNMSEYGQYFVIENVAPKFSDVKELGTKRQIEYGIEFYRGSK